MAINFFAEQIEYKQKHVLKIKKIVNQIAINNGKKIGTINFIFCNDEHVLGINKNYLQHDYFTDVITFDYTEKEKLSGDIYISIDTVKSNAEMYQVTFENEIKRVLFHGVLHLAGFNDKTKKEEKEMRRMEEFYLNMYEEQNV